MTNHEYLKQMPTDEFADWLCKQMWSDYGKDREDTGVDVVRFHQVRNFLLMENTKGGDQNDS